MHEKINKNSASLLNAVAALGMTLTNGLLGIVATRFIIAALGSDFNGLNSTANQIVNVLLIMEGGFTMASNVALFAPVTGGDISLINGILAATRRKFHRIGVLFMAAGALVCVGYTFVVNSQLPAELIFTVLWMTVLPAAFNLYYATTYRVLLQAQQKEYVISVITTVTIGLGHLANILMVMLGCKMWMVRFITMAFSFANSFLIAGYVRRRNRYLDLNDATPRADLIKGTNDVLVQKITGVIYNSAPIVFLSVSSAGGTVLASVYAVYNNVFTMIKSMLHAVIDAPRLSFGQMFTERKREQVWSAFSQYEYLAFLAVSVILATANTLILPFVRLYTEGVNDTNYNDPVIAFLMVGITAVEMVHIPSGHLINMAGLFRVSRNIQIIACVALLVCMTIGGALFGLYGMLGAILFVALLLAVMEMGYVHISFFPKMGASLLGLILPTAAICVFLVIVEPQLFARHIDGILSFVIFGGISGVINFSTVLLVNMLFHRKLVMALFSRARNLIHLIHKSR